MQINWNCYSPDRLKDAHWADVSMDDFACAPTIQIPQSIVSVSVGFNSTLRCYSTGDPLPSLTWVAEKKVLSNMTSIGESSDTYVVYTAPSGLGIESTLYLGIYGDYHPLEYTCIASNQANTVEKVIKVVVGADTTSTITEQSRINLYVLIGIITAVLILFLILTIIVICWCRQISSRKTSHSKLNGNIGDNGNVMVVASSSTVNPIGKPQRQYERLPQKDIEMTNVVAANASMEGPGGHKSFEELNYPSSNTPTVYGDRARLPPLEEEGGANTHLYPSLYPPHDNSSPTLTQLTSSQIPDLLDNARFPRTISPTQMSYQSLAYPPLNQDWRFSYAHPADYGVSSTVNGGDDYARSPVAYSTPQHQHAGYVTLPRRPRVPSWSGVPTPSPHFVTNPLLSPSVPPSETIYDTLGPRTTADGTSTTDLTRPGSRAALYEPLPPGGAHAAPISPHGLAAHYNTVAANKFASPRHMAYQTHARPGVSQTLPRSTPNLLDNNMMSIPQYRPNRTNPDPLSKRLHPPMENSEVDPLIEDSSTLGVPYDPISQYDSAATHETSMLMTDNDYNNSCMISNNNDSSKNNYNNAKKHNQTKKSKRQNETINQNLKPSISPSPSDKSSNRTMNSSVSPSPAPTPTPTQILYSASPHSDQQTIRPSPTPNSGLNGDHPPTFNDGGKLLPPLSPPPILSSTTTTTITTPSKKVPPKPPPKPSSKRLSVASITSEAGVELSRKPILSAGYQEEGPDGSEV